MSLLEKMNTRRARYHKKGFTIVELVVVIAVIGILATIVIVSYGAWQTSIQTAQVKNDLTQASTAMQSASSFGSGYPTTLPSSFTSAVGLTTYTSSSGVTTTLYSSTTSTFCIDGVSTANSSLRFYTDETHIKDQSAQAGTCSGRPANSIPAAPTNLAVTGYSTTVTLTWTAPSGIVSSYNLQCAEDSSFTLNMKQSTSTSVSGSVTGINPQTSQFCRVQAVNSLGVSPWSSVASVDTNPLTPPVGLAASSVNFSSITLTWSSNPDATSYNVQCAKDTGYSSGLVANSVTATTTQMNGLTPNTTYYCHINMVGGTGTSHWSGDLTTGTNDIYGSLATGTSIEGYWSTAPTGYLLEDGSAISRTQYADLFAVIGTTYGSGDGSTTFNLPDSRGRTSVNYNSSDAEFNAVGKLYGSKTDVQTVAQLPSHTHTQNPFSETYNFEVDGTEAAGYGLKSGGNGFGPRAYVTGGGTASNATTATNQNTGGSAAHNIIQPSIVTSFVIKYSAADSSAATPSVATSIHGYWTSAPSGYLLEDGSAVSRTTYSALFAVIGTTYGSGDGSTTFNLPDSRGRAAVNLSSSDPEFNTMGEKYGEKAHLMTVNEMPSHTHIQNSQNHSFGFYPTGAEAAGYGLNTSSAGFTNRVIVQGGSYTVGAVTATNQNTGGGTTENVIQPSIVQKAAIRFQAQSGSSTPVDPGTSVEGYWPSVPSGYLAEDGSAVSRTGYAALFAAIGTTYGAGNGSTTFNVPDSRGRLAVNLSASDSEFNTMGEKYGEKTHVMTINEMASHTHTQNATTVVVPFYTSGSEASGYAPDSSGTGFTNRTMVTGCCTASYGVTATNQNTGGGQAFNVIQPSIVKLFVIKY